eukprot:7736197-Lingulodinium_polyedra.AAC.1
MVRQVLAPSESHLPVRVARVRHRNEVQAPAPVSVPMRWGPRVHMHHAPSSQQSVYGRSDLSL